jgi:hypothetical protein
MAVSLKVYVPDRPDPVIDLPNSSMTVEEARRVCVSGGFTAVENADYEEKRIGSNGREIRFKRVSGGNKG